MAEHKGKKATNILQIDPLGGTSYKTIVCLVDQSGDNTRDEIDTRTYCEPEGSEPGPATRSRTFNAVNLYDPGSGRTSYADLRILFDAGTVFSYRKGPLTPVTGDVIETGLAYLTSLSDTESATDVDKFSGSFKPTVTPTVTVTV